MSAALTIVLAQLAPIPGDTEANLRAIQQARDEASKTGAALLVCPPGCLTGHPAATVAASPLMTDGALAAIERLIAATRTPGPALLFSDLWRDGESLIDAAILVGHGQVIGWRARHRLAPGEGAVLCAGAVPGPLALSLQGGGVLRLGVLSGLDLASEDVAEALVETGAQLLIGLARQTVDLRRPDLLLNEAVGRVTETGLPCAVAALAGAADDSVHTGGSFVLDSRCRLHALAPLLDPILLSTEWRLSETEAEPGDAPMHPPPAPDMLLRRVLALRLQAMIRDRHLEGVVLAARGRAHDRAMARLAREALSDAAVMAVAFEDRPPPAYPVAPRPMTLRTVEAELWTALSGTMGPAVAAPAIAADAVRAKLQDLVLAQVAETQRRLLLTAPPLGVDLLAGLTEDEIAALAAD